jgi:predicted RNA-binding protein with TRAM domain
MSTGCCLWGNPRYIWSETAVDPKEVYALVVCVRWESKMKEDRLQRLRQFVTEAKTELESLESQINSIESIIEAEDAHTEATSRDARNQVEIGETYDVIVEKPPGTDGPDGVARINGIITFVAPRDYSMSIGDKVRIKITDVGENHTRGIAIEEPNGGEAVAD